MRQMKIINKLFPRFLLLAAAVTANIVAIICVGYVFNANRATDISTARTIYNDCGVIMTDPVLAESFEGICNMAPKTRSGRYAKNNYTYDIYIIARKDANASHKWKSDETSTKTFVDELNKMEQNSVALKFRRLSNGGDLESWFVCRRKDDPAAYEVWAGDSTNNPKFRVWPETDENYK